MSRRTSPARSGGRWTTCSPRSTTSIPRQVPAGSALVRSTSSSARPTTPSRPTACGSPPVVGHSPTAQTAVSATTWSSWRATSTSSCARRPTSKATTTRPTSISPASKRPNTRRARVWGVCCSPTWCRGATRAVRSQRRSRATTAMSRSSRATPSTTSESTSRGVPMPRPDGRQPDELRPVTITRDWLDHAEGSVLVEFGRTRVLVAASVTQGVPRWRQGSGLGWVTAEYAMLPRATHTRPHRESVKGRLGGRTHEISRLVGRSLRACIDYKALGENTIVLDCDVLQADGGTRTAAITGAYVALADAVAWLKGRKRTKGDPLLTSVSAVSVGIIDGEPRLDLCYTEDVAAQTDMNVVCTASGDFVEIQGTAEQEPFSRDLLNQLLDLAVTGCGELTRLQHDALALSPAGWPDATPAGDGPPSRM